MTHNWRPIASAPKDGTLIWVSMKAGSPSFTDAIKANAPFMLALARWSTWENCWRNQTNGEQFIHPHFNTPQYWYPCEIPPMPIPKLQPDIGIPDNDTEAAHHIEQMLAEEEYFLEHGEPGDTDDA